MLDRLDSSTASAWPTYALLLVVGGWVFAPAPELQSSRPAPRPITPRPTLREERVEARLWQDPLASAHRHYAEEDALPARVDPGDRNDVIVLPVFLPGGPYAEDGEKRLRIRAAVLAGLNAAGFAPEDSEHLGAIRVFLDGSDSDAPNAEAPNAEAPDAEAPDAEAPDAEDPDGENPPDDGADPDGAAPRATGILVPYAWFGRKSAGKETADAVLTLWLDESAAGDHPLALLQATRNVIANGNAVIRAVGPSNSSTLAAMLAEVPAPPGEQQDVAKIELHSPFATASVADLGGPPKELLGSVGVAFTRHVGGDAGLVKALLHELELRHADAGHGEVLLVSEWDTNYGRGLHEQFVARIEKSGYGNNIVSAHYMRGIDGLVPDSKREERRAAAADQSPDLGSFVDRTRGVPAFGAGQIDYLDRLQQRFARAAASQNRVVAVGILGSDVYDKLLILQALRPIVPRAVFFTTDLDARLFDPKEFPWARNLVVASWYGLTPLIDVPKRKFRDSYQTATMRATLEALGLTGGSLPRIPRRFEIARGYEHELTWFGKKPGTIDGVDWDRVGHHALTVVLVAFIAILVLLLLAPFSASVRKATGYTRSREPGASSDRRKWQLRTWLGGLAVVSLMVVAIIDGSRVYGEPLSLTGGISVWPTEALRVLGGCMALAFTWRARRDLWRVHGRLQRKYALDVDLEGETFRRGVITNLKRKSVTLRTFAAVRSLVGTAFGRVVRGRGDDPIENKTGNVTEVFAEYARRREPWRYCQRSLLILIPYLGLGMVLFGLYRPSTPSRGDVAVWADRLTLLFALYAFFWLVLLVLDQIRLCRRLIESLSRRHSTWPSIPTRRTALDLGMEDDDVADLLDMEFTGDFTAVVSGLTYYPFIVLLVLLLARQPLFDNWDQPVSLMIVVSLSVTAILWSAFILRRATETARSKALASLRKRLSLHAGDSVRAKRLEHAIDHVASLRHGGFANVFENVALRAALIPFGGIGALKVLGGLG